MKTYETLATISSDVYFGGNGRYLYRPITKCACTTIKTLLLTLEGLPVDTNVWRRHKKQLNRFPGIAQFSPEEQIRILSGKTATFKFVFVRDPYARLLSCYADKIVRGQAYWVNQIRAWAQSHRIPLSENLTFEEFVRIVTLQDFHEMDQHWEPQYLHGCFELIKFDFIGRLEMMRTDLTYVLERIEAPDQIIGRASESHNDTEATMTEWENVSAEIRELFTAKFAMDFDQLCYPRRLIYDNNLS